MRRSQGRLDDARELLAAALEIRVRLGEVHLAHESRIALAGVAAASDEVDAALDEVVAVLGEEPTPPFTRCDEPIAAALDAISILRGSLPEVAESVRAAAIDWLLATADRIGDPGQRRGYLSDVAAHRRLLATGPIGTEEPSR